MVAFNMYMIFGFYYKMWAIPTGTSSAFKKKNQVKSPNIWSRTPNSVWFRQSGQAGIRGVTFLVSSSSQNWFTHISD